MKTVSDGLDCGEKGLAAQESHAVWVTAHMGSGWGNGLDCGLFCFLVLEGVGILSAVLGKVKRAEETQNYGEGK